MREREEGGGSQGERRKGAREGGGSDSVRFTHGFVDAYLHRHTPTRQEPVDITIKPAFASTLSFSDFAVVAVAVAVIVYRDHVASVPSLFSQSRRELRFLLALPILP